MNAYKKARFSIFLMCIIAITAILLSGCGEKKCELTEGTYAVSGDIAGIAISFDLTEKQFRISVLGSKFMSGEIKIENGKVNAITDNGLTYVFAIKDEKTIYMQKDESDTFVAVSGTGQEINESDNLEFVLVE